MRGQHWIDGPGQRTPARADRTNRCGAMTPFQSSFKLSISGPGPRKLSLDLALKTDFHQRCALSAQLISQTLVQIRRKADVALAVRKLLMKMQKVDDHRAPPFTAFAAVLMTFRWQREQSGTQFVK